jgi:hypothetical protein
VRWLIFALPMILWSMLYVGYYEAMEDGDVEMILFIKKHPTFQVEFINIHANDGDYRKVERLTAEQQKWMIDYCHYRLDIDTELKTQEDVETCSKK